MIGAADLTTGVRVRERKLHFCACICFLWCTTAHGRAVAAELERLRAEHTALAQEAARLKSFSTSDFDLSTHPHQPQPAATGHSCAAGSLGADGTSHGVSDLAQQLAQLQAANQELVAELATQQGQVAGKEAELAAVQEQLQAVQAELEAVQQELQAVQKELEAVRQELGAEQARAQDAAGEADDAAAQFDALESKLASLKAANDKLHKQTDADAQAIQVGCTLQHGSTTAVEVYQVPCSCG